MGQLTHVIPADNPIPAGIIVDECEDVVVKYEQSKKLNICWKDVSPRVSMKQKNNLQTDNGYQPYFW